MAARFKYVREVNPDKTLPGKLVSMLKAKFRFLRAVNPDNNPLGNELSFKSPTFSSVSLVNPDSTPAGKLLSCWLESRLKLARAFSPENAVDVKLLS